MKKSILLLSLLSAGLVLASCGNSSSVHVESVDITETSLELKEGASSDPLTVTVLPHLVLVIHQLPLLVKMLLSPL